MRDEEIIHQEDDFWGNAALAAFPNSATFNRKIVGMSSRIHNPSHTSEEYFHEKLRQLDISSPVHAHN